MAEAITFDDSRWPLLLVKHPLEPVDKQATLDYLVRLETYFLRNEKFVALFDVSGAKPPTAEHRFMVATWVKAKQDIIKPTLLGTAYVMPNLVQRLVLTTFLKFMDTTEIIGPVKVFNGMGKAKAWAHERLMMGDAVELKL
ncbi:MAG TPA: hypothetical protein VL728_14040 [Cyclobacteriaceae bacterium]|jgi:hypothetical protein|nr:hypothetical protein [Cyclobacteriaceae bacterium]